MVEGQRNGNFYQNGNFCQNGKFGQNYKLGHSSVRVTMGSVYNFRVGDHVFVCLGLYVSSSICNCVYVLDGGSAWQQFKYCCE